MELLAVQEVVEPQLGRVHLVALELVVKEMLVALLALTALRIVEVAEEVLVRLAQMEEMLLVMVGLALLLQSQALL
jgi:hypothetical protein